MRTRTADYVNPGHYFIDNGVISNTILLLHLSLEVVLRICNTLPPVPWSFAAVLEKEDLETLCKKLIL